MGKSTFITLLLLLVSAACATAGNPSAALDKACDKTPYDSFCELLLEPSAAQFEGHDPKKMGSAAMNATLDKVNSMKGYLVSLGVKRTKKPELKAAVMDCIDRLGRTETSLNAAVRDFKDADGPRKLGKADPVKMIDAATLEMQGCLEGLQKTEGDQKPVADGDDITAQALRQANETVLACYVAKAFVVLP